MLFCSKTDEFLRYQEETLDNSPGEMNQKRLCLANHLIPFFGQMLCDNITRRNVDEYAAMKRRAGFATSTINHHLTILRRYLSYQGENGYMAEMPKVKQLKMQRREETNYLTPAEVRELYIAADRHRNAGWKLMMVVAANTGMRIGEMLALDWKHVDLPEHRLHVRASYCRTSKAIKSTKSGHHRTVSLTESAAAALRELSRLEGKPTEGSVMRTNYDTAQRAMRVTSERANLGKDVTWHTLRHTFATALISMGQPLYVVAKLLGHGSIAHAERYAHLTRDRSHAAIRELDGVL